MDAAAYREREQEFGSGYEDLEPDDVRALIARTGDQLAAFVDDERAVEAAMKTLAEHAVGPLGESAAAADWRTLWSEGLDLNTAAGLPLAQTFTSLNAYAFFGLDPFRSREDDARSEVETLAAIEALVGKARAVFESIPAQWDPPAEMGRTLLAAEGRLALDQNDPITVEQLAALSRVNVRTIKNLLMPSSAHPLRTDKRGRIPASDAVGWIEKRSDFRTSIWAVSGETDEESAADAFEMAGFADEVVFVPVASDGSWFDPKACRRGDHYVIGPKGAEQKIGDYREALARLAAMSKPRWRRPNEHGNWGIVRADSDRWLRKTVRELGLGPTP